MAYSSFKGCLILMRTLFFRLVKAILGVAAKAEFHLWADSHEKNQLFRKIYMKAMGVKYGRQLYCGPDVMVRMRGGVTLGERCSLGYSTQLWNYENIIIGSDFVGAPGLTITTGGHDPVSMQDTALPILIGDRCWCGVNVTILAGVRIGDDVVIAAGSVVNRDVPSCTIVGGVPAKPLKNFDRVNASYQARAWGLKN